MDYDLWLRFGKQSNPYFISEYLSAFRTHASSKSENQYVAQFKEGYRITSNYTNSKFVRLLHWINSWKIILVYKLIK